MLQGLLNVDVAALGSRYQKGFSELKSIFELLIDLVIMEHPLRKFSMRCFS